MGILEDNTPTLIAIKDSNDHCFGALISENLKMYGQGKFYGNGQSFLWRTRPERLVSTRTLSLCQAGFRDGNPLQMLP